MDNPGQSQVAMGPLAELLYTDSVGAAPPLSVARVGVTSNQKVELAVLRVLLQKSKQRSQRKFPGVLFGLLLFT